jgi:hypothetical protein
MAMKKKFTSYAFVTVGILMLTGCGEGYEISRYEGFPYGNERTAGTGIAYVRAKMMSEKGPVIEDLEAHPKGTATEPRQEALEPEPVEEFPEEAEKLFKEMQKK